MARVVFPEAGREEIGMPNSDKYAIVALCEVGRAIQPSSSGSDVFCTEDRVGILVLPQRSCGPFLTLGDANIAAVNALENPIKLSPSPSISADCLVLK